MPAQSASSPNASFNCSPLTSQECAAQRKRKQEDERANRSTELGAPQAVGDAPLPPQGETPPPPVITREPLHVRRLEASLGVDYALSPRWVIGGLIGGAKTRLQRFQTERVQGQSPDSVGQTSDTTVRTRTTSLAATLTHYPRDDVFIDLSVLYGRSHLDVERNVNDLALFYGNHDGRTVSVSLSTGGVWRYPELGGLALVPQIGLEYANNRLNALKTRYFYTQSSDPTTYPGFTVSQQHATTVSALASVQAQWPISTALGTLNPYVRTGLRERLSLHGDDVVAKSRGAPAVVTEAQDQSSPRGISLGGGVLAQLPGGTSVFVDLGWTRGQGQLRETKVAVGLKLER
jgi:hypothetical protein